MAFAYGRTMRLSIRHITSYRYDKPVTFSDHRLFLRPRDGHLLQTESFEVATVPDARQRWVHDWHDNIVLVASFGMNEGDELRFDCSAIVRIRDHNPFDFILDEGATAFPFFYQPRLQRSLAPYLGRGRCGDSLQVRDWFHGAVPSPVSHPDVVAFLSDLNNAICRDIAYQRRDEEGIQSPDETLELRRGSCRDMAVLFMEACRQLGLAARFVSGYLYEPPADTGERVGNRAQGAMHAWAEVYLPGAGWKGFDPTNGILADHCYVPSAVSDEPTNVDPVQGSFFAAGAVDSHMTVELIIEAMK
ncbi:MAG: transglutaminase family protein [Xanthomonadales bacterium]|nr:transglutaminase family protein [Xanthomonadales bacterium]